MVDTEVRGRIGSRVKENSARTCRGRKAADKPLVQAVQNVQIVQNERRRKTTAFCELCVSVVE